MMTIWLLVAWENRRVDTETDFNSSFLASIFTSSGLEGSVDDVGTSSTPLSDITKEIVEGNGRQETDSQLIGPLESETYLCQTRSFLSSWDVYASAICTFTQRKVASNPPVSGEERMKYGGNNQWFVFKNHFTQSLPKGIVLAVGMLSIGFVQQFVILTIWNEMERDRFKITVQLIGEYRIWWMG